MAFRGPLIDEEHLPMGVAPGLDNNRADGVDYIIERPAEDGLPEVIRIVDNDDGQLPIYISSDEEEDGEVVIAFAPAGDGIPPGLFDEEDESDDYEDDEETDDDDDWSDLVSEDSGYDSMYEEEEDLEDHDDDDDIRPPSPLIQPPPPPVQPPTPPVQPFAPGPFWQRWLRKEHPVAFPIMFGVPCDGVLFGPVALYHLEVPVPQVDPPEDGLQPGFPRSEKSAPSTSALSSSLKRSREESYTEQVSKRQRCNSEESHEEPAPSTSGLGPSTNRSTEDSYRDSAPSTSGLGPSSNRKYWQGPFGFPWWVDDSDTD